LGLSAKRGGDRFDHKGVPCLPFQFLFVFRGKLVVRIAVFLLCGVAECITTMRIATLLLDCLQYKLTRWFRWPFETEASAEGGIPRISSLQNATTVLVKNAMLVSRRFATGLRNSHSNSHLQALLAAILLIRQFGMPNALRKVSSAKYPSAGRARSPRMRGRRRL
jgi:hypothetical protein